MKDKIPVVKKTVAVSNPVVLETVTLLFRVFHRKFKILYIQFLAALSKFSNGHRAHKLVTEI